MLAARRPDIEFKRKLKDGSYRSYGHIYFKPLVVFLFGRMIIDLRRRAKV